MRKKIQKVVIFGDEHGAMREMNVINHILAHHGDADIYVRAGDSLNNEEASPFPGSYPHKRAVDEHNEWCDFTEWFMGNIHPKARVYLLSGNHDGPRVKRWQKASMNPTTELYSYTDCLSIMADGQKMVFKEMPAGGHAWVPEKVYDWPNLYYRSGLNSYVGVLGKNALVTHAYKSMKLSSSMARLWFFETILTRYPDTRIVFQAHTHRRADHRYGPFRYIELGCSCRAQEYGDVGGRSGYPPMHNGYAVCYLDPNRDMVDTEHVELIDLGHQTHFSPVPML